MGLHWRWGTNISNIVKISVIGRLVITYYCQCGFLTWGICNLLPVKDIVCGSEKRSLRSRWFFPFSRENRALKRENERAVVNIFSIINFFFQGPRGRGGSLGRGGTPGIPVSKCHVLVLKSTVFNNYSTSARLIWDGFSRGPPPPNPYSLGVHWDDPPMEWNNWYMKKVAKDRQLD